jgi:hypothetical protein
MLDEHGSNNGAPTPCESLRQRKERSCISDERRGVTAVTRFLVVAPRRRSATA